MNPEPQNEVPRHKKRATPRRFKLELRYIGTKPKSSWFRYNRYKLFRTRKDAEQSMADLKAGRGNILYPPIDGPIEDWEFEIIEK